MLLDGLFINIFNMPDLFSVSSCYKPTFTDTLTHSVFFTSIHIYPTASMKDSFSKVPASSIDEDTANAFIHYPSPSSSLYIDSYKNVVVVK